MAARKKRPAKPATIPRTTAAFVVVLEDLNAKFNVFGEALQGVRQEVHELRGGLQEVRQEVHELRGGLQEVRGGLQEVREELQEVREELHGFRHEVDQRFGRVELAVLENAREIREVRGELGEVRASVTRIESALALKVDRDEVESIVQRVIARR